MPVWQFALLIAAIGGVPLWLASRRRMYQARQLERVLYLEVASLRLQAGAMAEELAVRHAAGTALDAEFFWQWRLSIPLLYPATAQAMGSLSLNAIDRLGYFYAQLGEARERLKEVRATGGDLPNPYRLLSNLLRAYNHVEPWLQAQSAEPGAIFGGYPEIRNAHELLEALETEAAEPMAVPYCWADCAAPIDDADTDDGTDIDEPQNRDGEQPQQGGYQ